MNDFTQFIRQTRHLKESATKEGVMQRVQRTALAALCMSLTQVAFVGLAATTTTAPASAQAADSDMDFGAGEEDFSSGDADSDMDFGGTEAEAEAAAESSGAGGGSSLLDDLAIEDDDSAAVLDEGPAPTETVEEIYAVQRVYALRLKRLEVSPFIAFTVNDPYISHPGVGGSIQFWPTNVLSLGANFIWYKLLAAQQSDLSFSVQRATRLAVPVTDWQMAGYFNFSYVPFYGKFAMFNKSIFQWDSYIVGGVGFMRTKPVAVIDPEVREFTSYNTLLAFNVGLGIRIFLNQWLALFTEFRNYMYFEQYENLTIALGNDREEVSTWEAPSQVFTNNATVQVGFTLFFPFKFEYRQPR